MNDIINIVGCGYIGQLIALKLIKQQYNPVGFVSSEKSLKVCRQKQINVHQLNLDIDTSALNVDRQPLIYLVPPPPKGDEDTRIKHFLKAIIKHPPSKIVLISTTGVYGDCKGEWVEESRELKPLVARAKRRVDAERQLIDYCQSCNIPWVILRVPGIYGPGKFPVKRIKSGEPIVCEQDSPYSNRIHAYDLVDICIQAILAGKITGVYNCSDGNPTTMYDYFVNVADALQLERPPEISLQVAQQKLSKGMMSYIAESRRVSNKKLLQDFNFTLKYPDLESGLAELKEQ